jgi:flavin-dependent dehydrogenase
MDFDVVIIGAGPGGYVTAIRAAQLGLKTAIVEREALGGVCLNWGCIPTKALLKSGEVYEQLGHLEDYGLSAKGRAYDFTAVIERSRKVAKQLNSGVGHLLKKNKVDVVMGEAAIAAKGKVTIKTANGEETLQGKNVIVATAVATTPTWLTRAVAGAPGMASRSTRASAPSFTLAIRLSGSAINTSIRSPVLSSSTARPGETFSPTSACTAATRPSLGASSPTA